ncbi:GAF and ANTAR domain-containing protein [Arthrobacter sp. AD-310]
MNSDVFEGTAFADVAVYLQDLVLENVDVDQLLGGLAGYAAARLEGTAPALSCGISIERPKKRAVAAGSDPVARLLGQLAPKCEGAPGAAAAAGSGGVVVPDLRAEKRWPEYVRAARRQGVLSLVCLPLVLDDGDSGVLNLYSGQAGAFAGAGLADAEAFAVQASKGLRLALRMEKLQDARDGLKAAMRSRTVIDLATGAIMAQSRCSQAEAFQVLRTASNTRNTKLREVAYGVVSSVAGSPETFTYFDG